MGERVTLQLENGRRITGVKKSKGEKAANQEKGNATRIAQITGGWLIKHPSVDAIFYRNEEIASVSPPLDTHR